MSSILSQLLDPNVIATFIASLRSVGAACMLAAVGVYLHRRGFIVGEGKKTLALICQQALIPTYLCVKTMYCEQNQSSQACPDVVKSLNQIWVLLVWPAYVVGMGSVVATIMRCIIKPKPEHVKPMYAATMFGNSTALPITMLTVVHSNFPNKSVLGKVDPTLFLSIYLLLYPVLQWGIGGWLLAPPEEEELVKTIENGQKTSSYGATNTDGRTRSTATLDTSERVSTIAEESSQGASGSGSGTSSPATDHEMIALLRKEEFDSAKEFEQEERNPSSNSNKPWVFRNVVNILPTPPSFIRTTSLSHTGESEAHRKSVSLGDLPGVFPSGGGSGSSGGLGFGRNRSESIGSYGHYTDEHPTGPGGHNTSLDQSQRSDSHNNGLGLRHRHSSVHHTSAYELRLEREAHDPEAIAVNHQTGMVPVDPFVNFVPRHNSMNCVSSSSQQRLSGDNMVGKGSMEEQQLEQHHHEPATAAYGTTNFWEMFFKIMDRVFQPACCGALLGLAITAMPSVRGLFIDMDNRADNAPLEWMYDALLQVGQSSIPIIMIVLGCNLSASQLVEDQTRLLDSRVVVAIILSKMVIMPIIGFTTILFLRTYVWHIDPAIAPSFYLVTMIVFITPTANNVMVMIELSGSNVKEGVARVIAYQYMLAPFLLSITMAIAVGIAQKS